MNKIKITLLTFLFLGINSCIDPFTLNLENNQQAALVIYGDFSTDKRAHQLEIYTTDSQIIRNKQPITGATATLVADDTGEREDYQVVSAGVYEVNGSTISGATGSQYHIEICLPNGNKYQSRPATMPRKIRGDSAFIQINAVEELLVTGAITTKSFLEVFVDSPLPTDNNDYWLKYDVTTLYSFFEIICSPLGPPPDICFIPGRNDPQQISLVNGQRFNGSRLENFKVNQKRLLPDNFEYRGRHYFLVNQQSITEDAFDYWDKLNRVANQTGSIFDAPPAGVPGNIYNVNDPAETVLGYFELTNTDSLRTFITEGEIFQDYQFTTLVCPSPFRFNNQFFRECCNCELIEGATLERPSWF